MDTEEKITSRKQRWIDFYDPSLPPTRLFWIHEYSDLAARPWPYPDQIEQRIEWSWQKYQIQVSQLKWLEDDSLPFLDIYTGTELFAEAFGCPIHLPGNEMPFAMPLAHNAEDADRVLIPPLDAPPLARVWRIARELKKRAGPGALLRLPDIQSPMDIAALIWEKSSFYAALVEQPEAVAVLAGKVRTLLTGFLDAWFAEFGSEFIAHYPDYYVPRGVTLSEDEVGVVSPAIFQRFFLPELEELSRRYGGRLGMHCCAHARHQWQGFQQIPGLFLLNLVQPPEILRKAYPAFEPICAQMHSWYGEGDRVDWPAQHPPERRIIYDLSAASREEALALLEKLRPYR
jgi:hypothetical protein